jgi:hypothetical protein
MRHVSHIATHTEYNRQPPPHAHPHPTTGYAHPHRYIIRLYNMSEVYSQHEGSIDAISHHENAIDGDHRMTDGNHGVGHGGVGTNVSDTNVVKFLAKIATGLRGETGTYEGHDKFYWYDYLYRTMLKERRGEPGADAFLEEITTVTPEQFFMHKLTVFERTGEGYHEGLEEHFPLFKGPAPKGHPYPGAFAS